MKLPYTKWFWRDWQSDSGLRACSLAARGLWKEMLCIMAQCDRYGHLLHGGAPMTDAQLARMVGSDVTEIQSLRSELLTAQVPSVEGEIWFSRRLVRDHELRDKLSAAGKKGGNPLLKSEEEDHSQEPINPLTQEPIGPTPPLQEGLSPTLKPSDKPSNLSTNPPTLEDCIAAASAIGMRREDIVACFHHYNAQGWKRGNTHLTSLSSLLATWKANTSNFQKPNKAKTHEDRGEFPAQEYKAKEL